jgi:hypothetical protein
MYIKWKRRRYVSRGGAAMFDPTRAVLRWTKPGELSEYWEAVLVRAARVNGKPRQEVLARLGSFSARRLAVDYWAEQRQGSAVYWADYRSWHNDARLMFWGPVTVILHAGAWDGRDDIDWGRSDHVHRQRLAVAALQLDEATIARLESQLAARIPLPPEHQPFRRDFFVELQAWRETQATHA